MHILHLLMEASNSLQGLQQQEPVQPDQPVQQPVVDPAAQQLAEPPEMIEFKKYIIFGKLKELKDSLENASIVYSKDYKDVVYFINILITFYDIFEYEQLINIINVLIDKIEKLKKK